MKKIQKLTFNHKFIGKLIAIICMLEGVAMVPAAFCAIFLEEYDAAWALCVTSFIGIMFGAAGSFATRKHKIKIRIRESYYVVLVCWLTTITMSIFPYWLSNSGYSLSDSIFESVASWTTSSAWVIDIDTIPKSLILWKATSNWLGGMGVVLLAILIMSVLGVEGQKMANAEIPGPTLEKAKPRMLDTAKVLYGVYILISVIEMVLLMAGDVPFFDALVNTMSSVSTAGVMDYRDCVSIYFTPYVKAVLIIFSVIASLNFILFIKLREGKVREVFRDYELRIFLMIIAIASLFIAFMLILEGRCDSFGSALIDAAAGAGSFGTTSGIAIENVETWPSVCKVVLFTLMIIGGCANSTSGGIKVIRAAIYMKLIHRGMYKRIHPQAIRPIMIKKRPVSAQNASSISTFILLFTAIYLFSCVVLSLENFDMETTITAPMALFTNTGVGFGLTSGAYYGDFSALGKLYASLLMMAGRLEMYAILIVFSRSFWNADRIK